MPMCPTQFLSEEDIRNIAAAISKVSRKLQGAASKG